MFGWYSRVGLKILESALSCLFLVVVGVQVLSGKRSTGLLLRPLDSIPQSTLNSNFLSSPSYHEQLHNWDCVLQIAVLEAHGSKGSWTEKIGMLVSYHVMLFHILGVGFSPKVLNFWQTSWNKKSGCYFTVSWAVFEILNYFFKIFQFFLCVERNNILKFVFGKFINVLLANWAVE